jgi:hypothetical protein
MTTQARMVSAMPLDQNGEPRLPRNAAEQARFDSGARSVRDKLARDSQHVSTSRLRTDGKFDECTSCGATLDAEDPGVESGLCSKCRTTDTDRARQRMQRRAANAWREPLDKAGQMRLDEARLLRDEQESDGPDAA